MPPRLPPDAPSPPALAPRPCSPPPAAQTTTSVSKVRLQAGESVEGAFLFVGDLSTNNGMDNPVCAMVRDGSPVCLGVGVGWARRGPSADGAWGPQLGGCLRPAAPALPLRQTAREPPTHPLSHPPTPPTPPQNIDLPANTAVEVECSAPGR